MPRYPNNVIFDATSYIGARVDELLTKRGDWRWHGASPFLLELVDRVTSVCPGIHREDQTIWLGNWSQTFSIAFA